MANERIPEELAKIITDFFLADSKWEDDGDGWLWIYDANYGFRPLDLAKAIIKGAA
jgi:hypothetical protein